MAEVKKHSPHGESTAMANAEAAEARRADVAAAQASAYKKEDLLLKDLHAKLLVYKYEKSNWRGKSPRSEGAVNKAHQELLDAIVQYLLHNSTFLEPEQIRALVKRS